MTRGPGISGEAQAAGSAPFPGYMAANQPLSFAHDSQQGLRPEPDGPVLVMPPPPEPKRPQPLDAAAWLVVFVLFCLEVGIILTVLPWTRIWTENSLLLGHPQIHDFLMQNFVRGLVSGLGLVDIWMGVAEAVRYRESPECIALTARSALGRQLHD